jgi:hypothetical protein
VNLIESVRHWFEFVAGIALLLPFTLVLMLRSEQK